MKGSGEGSTSSASTPAKQQQQQGQQQSDDGTTAPPSGESEAQQQPAFRKLTPLEKQRQDALKEAEQVLESMGTNQLDHFNLLGVVANPRGSQHGGVASTSHSAMSSVHGPTSVSSSGGDSSWLPDTYTTLESTLTSVTEQIESLNHVFEEWSRQYLNDTYYHDAPDTIPESQLQELPPELVQLDLSSLQAYLNESGVLATTYQRNAQEMAARRKKQEDIHQQMAGAKTPPGKPTLAPAEPTAPSPMDSLVDIPELFFQPEFDLTDPKTFRELILNEDDGLSSSSVATAKPKQDSLTLALEEPTLDLFQLPPPDHFTGFLDKVEVALLEQVREKSESFFQETNRFALLKEWVGELLVDVQRIRNLMESQAKAVQSWQQVPEWDKKRKHMVKMEAILEGSSDILSCKQSIGALLSVKDDLGAVEQIQYARRLLTGTNNNDDEERQENGSSSLPAVEEEEEEGGEGGSEQAISSQKPPQQAQHVADAPIELGRLLALKTVGEQLNQYESLVVTSLTEELVEIFLEWNTSPLSSLYGGLTNGGGGGSTPSLNRAASSQNEMQRRTVNIVTSLRMCHSLDHMTQFYSTRLHDMVRMTVRTTVGEFASDVPTASSGGTSVSANVAAMSLERFIDCLDMLFEQLLALLNSASGVDEFCRKEGLTLKDNDEKKTAANGRANGDGDENAVASDNKTNGTADSAEKAEPETAIGPIVASASELSSKNVAELLRLRKEVHSLLTLDEMRKVWDTCMNFVEEVEKLSRHHKCVALRSMLLTQAKAFVERKHDSNMTSLAAALDSERWTQCEVSVGRQMALNRLCSGRAGISTGRRLVRGTSTDDAPSSSVKMPEAEVEGIRYKVVWSCLLLVEMVMTNIEAAACFQSLASNVVGKVAELLRLFNTRTTALVLGARAMHSAARLKSINAKHLSLVTQCLGMILAILPHIRAALMSQLPHKQYTLLTDIDKIKKEYEDHNENVKEKFVSIIHGIVEHGLAKHIGGTDFDVRANNADSSENGVACCVFFEGVLTNTKKMHQVLSALLPPHHLEDVFSRIFASLDRDIPALLIKAASNGSKTSGGNGKTSAFKFPTTDKGKKRLLDEVDTVTKKLNAFEGVQPWEFNAVSDLAKTLGYEMPSAPTTPIVDEDKPSAPEDAPGDGEHAEDEGEDEEESPKEDTESLRTEPESDTATLDGQEPKPADSEGTTSGAE